MDTLPFLAISGAAVAGALVGAAAAYWPLSRGIIELRERLERSEQARNGAVERSAQAREQVAQLNRAITELHRTHRTPASQVTARQQIESALADGDEKAVALARRKTGQAFADTQVMSKL